MGDPTTAQQGTQPHGDTVRQIQLMVAILQGLPTGGRLREIFEYALRLDNGPLMSRARPADDTSFSGLMSWMENTWALDGLSDDEKRLVDWQRDEDAVTDAVQELEAIQASIGVRLVPQQTA